MILLKYMIKVVRTSVIQYFLLQLTSFLPLQVATANLAWASVAIHQVQVGKRPQRTGLDLKFDTVADFPSCYTSLNTWTKVKPVRPTYYDLGWLCLFWFCTGVFNGEIHCVQELGCHWAQSNQLSHRFNKQLPKDVITPQCCFYRDSITPLRSSFPLQHWPQWTSEHQRAVEHCSALHSWVSCSLQNTIVTESRGRSPRPNVQTCSWFLYGTRGMPPVPCEKCVMHLRAGSWPIFSCF